MSEEAKVQSNEAQAVQSDSDEPVVANKTAEELAKRLKEVSLEAKQHRQKNAELKRQLEEKEKAKLQEQGQFKELADIWQRKAEEKETLANKLKDAFAFKTVADSVALEASKMGCVDPEALINLLPMNQVPIDENFSVDKESVKAMVEDFKKTKPYFFKSQAPKIIDSHPTKAEEPRLDLGKMTLAERAALLSQLNKQGK